MVLFVFLLFSIFVSLSVSHPFIYIENILKTDLVIARWNNWISPRQQDYQSLSQFCTMYHVTDDNIKNLCYMVQTKTKHFEQQLRASQLILSKFKGLLLPSQVIQNSSGIEKKKIIIKLICFFFSHAHLVNLPKTFSHLITSISVNLQYKVIIFESADSFAPATKQLKEYHPNIDGDRNWLSQHHYDTKLYEKIQKHQDPKKLIFDVPKPSKSSVNSSKSSELIQEVSFKLMQLNWSVRAANMFLTIEQANKHVSLIKRFQLEYRAFKDLLPQSFEDHSDIIGLFKIMIEYIENLIVKPSLQLIHCRSIDSGNDNQSDDDSYYTPGKVSKNLKDLFKTTNDKNDEFDALQDINSIIPGEAKQGEQDDDFAIHFSDQDDSDLVDDNHNNNKKQKKKFKFEGDDIFPKSPCSAHWGTQKKHFLQIIPQLLYQISRHHVYIYGKANLLLNQYNFAAVSDLWSNSKGYRDLFELSKQPLKISVNFKSILKNSVDPPTISIDRTWVLLGVIDNKSHIIPQSSNNKGLIQDIKDNLEDPTMPTGRIIKFKSHIPFILSYNITSQFSPKLLCAIVDQISNLCQIFHDVACRIILFLIQTSNVAFKEWLNSPKHDYKVADETQSIDYKVIFQRKVQISSLKNWLHDFLTGDFTGYRRVVWMESLLICKKINTYGSVRRTFGVQSAYIMNKLSQDPKFALAWRSLFVKNRGVFCLKEINHVKVNHLHITTRQWQALGRPGSAQSSLNRVSNASRFTFMDDEPNQKLKTFKNLSQVFDELKVYRLSESDAVNPNQIIVEKCVSEYDLTQKRGAHLDDNKLFVYPYGNVVDEEDHDHDEALLLKPHYKLLPGFQRIVQDHRQVPKPQEMQQLIQYYANKDQNKQKKSAKSKKFHAKVSRARIDKKKNKNKHRKKQNKNIKHKKKNANSRFRRLSGKKQYKHSKKQENDESDTSSSSSRPSYFKDKSSDLESDEDVESSKETDEDVESSKS